MAITTFSGPVRSLGGFVESGFNNAIDATAALTGGTLALTALPIAVSAPGVLPATTGSPGHAGKELTITADGGTFTLPLINAINPGANAAAGQGQGGASDPNQTSNLGMQFRFTVLVDITTNLIINTGAVADVIFGTINFCDDANDAGVAGFFMTPGTANTVTFNGTTQGGDAGSTFTLTAVGANAWKVEGVSVFPTASAPATPFSTRV
tara:strand:- start:1152 stop:1778 length:627 start_codon:yes stop_codon:yes gene_type:complete